MKIGLDMSTKTTCTKCFKGLALFLCILGFSRLEAQQTGKPEIYSPEGKAIHGYDAVSFFEDNEPSLGLEDHVWNYKGADWFFTTEENLMKFKQNPDTYIPQYGGYCAYGMSNGYKAPTQVDTWTIQEGKLFFNYNLKVKKKWQKNKIDFIEKADNNWLTLKNK